MTGCSLACFNAYMPPVHQHLYPSSAIASYAHNLAHQYEPWRFRMMLCPFCKAHRRIMEVVIKTMIIFRSCGRLRFSRKTCDYLQPWEAIALMTIYYLRITIRKHNIKGSRLWVHVQPAPWILHDIHIGTIQNFYPSSSRTYQWTLKTFPCRLLSLLRAVKPWFSQWGIRKSSTNDSEAQDDARVTYNEHALVALP